MKEKVFNIVSGAKSGALNIAITVGDFLKSEGYQVETILRKYNKTGMADVTIVKDRCTFDYIYSLARLLIKQKPSVIFVHGYSTHIWTKMAVAYAKIDVRLIHVEHNAEKYTPLRSWLVKKLDQYTFQYICVSQGVAENLIKQGVTQEKVHIVYNGIDIDQFDIPKLPHEIYTIGMTARFSKQKDQMTLIKAVEQLIKTEHQALRLILLGEGKTKTLCAQYVESVGLTESVIFKTGQFTDIIPELDLFVLSTHYEGFGLVVVEAMAAKIPVIATDVVGVNEIITPGENGFLVRENDFLGLAERIKEMFDQHDTEEERKITDAARTMVEKRFAKTMMLDCYVNKIKEDLQ